VFTSFKVGWFIFASSNSQFVPWENFHIGSSSVLLFAREVHFLVSRQTWDNFEMKEVLFIVDCFHRFYVTQRDRAYFIVSHRAPDFTGLALRPPKARDRRGRWAPDGGVATPPSRGCGGGGCLLGRSLRFPLDESFLLLRKTSIFTSVDVPLSRRHWLFRLATRFNHLC
jgi:hypothetical protein